MGIVTENTRAHPGRYGTLIEQVFPSWPISTPSLPSPCLAFHLVMKRFDGEWVLHRTQTSHNRDARCSPNAYIRQVDIEQSRKWTKTLQRRRGCLFQTWEILEDAIGSLAGTWYSALSRLSRNRLDMKSAFSFALNYWLEKEGTNCSSCTFHIRITYQKGQELPLRTFLGDKQINYGRCNPRPFLPVWINDHIEKVQPPYLPFSRNPFR